jgi:Putative zincin peptidase
MPVSLAFGKPPRNTLLDTEPGWSQVPGYDDSVAATLRAIGIGLLLAVLLAAAWYVLVPNGLPVNGSPPASSMILVFLIVTVVHELCHLALFPRFGLRHSIVGLWPQMGAVFVQYLQPVSRARFIAATLAPTIVICALPLALGIAGLPIPAFLQWASVLNGLAVGADLLAVVVLLRHTSARHLVLDSNHALFRRQA